MFEAREDAEVFYIGKRTGAFRLALEHGSIMLAGFCCGAQEVMSAWYDGYGVLKGVSRTLRMSLLWPYGRWFLPIPRRVALILVYAPPVECEQADAPTEEQVFDLRDRFLDAVQESFDVGKQIYPGWEKRRLIIKTD
uniref:Acyltransferase n=2 Tax=Phaeomonas parva TaxID=124430 RepID=A0A7S1TPI4_9STRA|mmetsp:Transcript_11740/g.35625  ORF Transcript_11740/g.35625 Transcript_11740/m.35625 type:complete len:137 (+) Transcript_11740:844-1254(+)